jgi:hypothetical protein
MANLSSTNSPPALQEVPQFKNPRTRAVVLFFLALAMRLTYIVLLHTYRHIDSAELISVARCLAHFHMFGNPFPTPTGPTAIVAPGYPFLLSLIYSAFGLGVLGEVVQEIACTLVTSLGIAMLVFFAEAGDFAVGAGVLAASLGALLPTKLWIETKGAWSTPYDALILLLLCVFTLRHWKQPRLTVGNAVLHGILWGSAMLFAPAFLPILLAFLFAGWFLIAQKQRAAYVGWACLLFVAVLIILTPWTVRNFKQFGGIVFIRDNLGLELFTANNDRALPTLEENMKLPKRPHPNDNHLEAEELMRQGELRYNKQKLGLAIRWIGDHPSRFVFLTMQRFLYFWFPNSDRIWKRVLAGAITLLAWLGFFFSCRTHRLASIMIAVLWIVYPLIYYIMQADPRYPYPIYWTLLLMAAVSILHLGTRSREPVRSEASS